MRKALIALAYALGLPIVLVLIWYVATLGATNPFVPKPLVLVETFAETWFGDRISNDILPSLARFVVGTGLAIVIGIILGLAVGLSRGLRAYTEPVFEFFRALPPPVLIPILALILGATDGMRISVIVLGAVWPVLLNTIEGVRSADEVQTETSRSYGITGWGRIRHQVLPSAAPQIMAGVRQALPIGIILMVIGEMLYSTAGLGYSITQFQRQFAVSQMWSGILLLGLLGFVVSLLFKLVERRVLRWYHGLKDLENAS
ncbi:ABC transporter permease [Microbacterium halophytorum]|uniref:ABC transporter permease n=1 Tax=Microbacterium halophytorum TaxID=2067568 RepID=UPI000CFC302C|nr:ABC transporter permease [Microbacterium halophytorum]